MRTLPSFPLTIDVESKAVLRQAATALGPLNIEKKQVFFYTSPPTSKKIPIFFTHATGYDKYDNNQTLFGLARRAEQGNVKN